MQKYNHKTFTVLVVGDNPEEVMSNFDDNNTVDEPYILYKRSDIGNIRVKKIKIYSELLKTLKGSDENKQLIEHISLLKSMTDEEYFESLSEYYQYDSEGNIISYDNPNGKWDTCDECGKIFPKPFITKDGKHVSSTNKKDIDWSLIHRNSERVALFSRTWDLCVDKMSPETDKDKLILHNFRQYPNYFNIFGNKEWYVNYSTSFSADAIVINGIWVDKETHKDIIWVSDFYNNFIERVGDNELLTVFECIN